MENDVLQRIKKKNQKLILVHHLPSNDLLLANIGHILAYYVPGPGIYCVSFNPHNPVSLVLGTRSIKSDTAGRTHLEPDCIPAPISSALCHLRSVGVHHPS